MNRKTTKVTIKAKDIKPTGIGKNKYNIGEQVYFNDGCWCISLGIVVGASLSWKRNTTYMSDKPEKVEWVYLVKDKEGRFGEKTETELYTNFEDIKKEIIDYWKKAVEKNKKDNFGYVLENGNQ